MSNGDVIIVGKVWSVDGSYIISNSTYSHLATTFGKNNSHQKVQILLYVYRVKEKITFAKSVHYANNIQTFPSYFWAGEYSFSICFVTLDAAVFLSWTVE